MTIKSLRHFFLACFALGCASLAQADIIVALPDYEGSFYDFSSTFPPDPISIGTFSFTIPKGDIVTGATISGTFGDVNFSTTALTDLFVLNGTIEVGACDSTSDPCFAGTIDGSLVPWSHTFNATQLGELASDLASGSLDFTAAQTFPGSVIVGAPTLDLQVVPEPVSIFTLAGGLFAIAALRRRK